MGSLRNDLLIPNKFKGGDNDDGELEDLSMMMMLGTTPNLGSTPSNSSVANVVRSGMGGSSSVGFANAPRDMLNLVDDDDELMGEEGVGGEEGVFGEEGVGCVVGSNDRGLCGRCCGCGVLMENGVGGSSACASAAAADGRRDAPQGVGAVFESSLTSMAGLRPCCGRQQPLSAASWHQHAMRCAARKAVLSCTWLSAGMSPDVPSMIRGPNMASPGFSDFLQKAFATNSPKSPAGPISASSGHGHHGQGQHAHAPS